MITKWLSKNKKKKLLAVKVVFIVYIVVLLFLVFLGREYSIGYSTFNIKPFTSIILYFRSLINQSNFQLWALNILGNIFVFIPLGFFLPILFKKYRSFFKAAIFVVCFSLAIEVLQFISNFGIFDIDDIILNSIGGFVGYGLFGIMK